MGVDTLTQPRKRAVFLDRDGVVNRALVRDGKPHPPSNLKDLEILPGVPEALEQLKKLGFLLLVITNQPDVARGRQTRSMVEAMHWSLQEILPIDDFFVCYHDDDDLCGCRKPKPGLLLEAQRKYGLALEDCFVVGDRWRDMDAAASAGCTAIWINRGYTERGPSTSPAAIVGSTTEAANWIVASGKGEVLNECLR